MDNAAVQVEDYSIEEYGPSHLEINQLSSSQMVMSEEYWQHVQYFRDKPGCLCSVTNSFDGVFNGVGGRYSDFHAIVPLACASAT